MPRFYIEDFRSLEKAPFSPRLLYAKIGNVILSSTQTQASLESANPETGEYRVVLTGRLDLQGSRLHRW
jgi:hypothetical protein